MMNFKKTFIVLLIVLLAAVSSQAATLFGAGGTGYASRYFGVRYAGLGGAGLALADSLYLPLHNPGGWYSQGWARYSIHSVMQRNVASDNNGTDNNEDFVIPSLMLNMPIYKSIALGISYEKLYDQNYLFFDDSTFTPDPPLDTLQTFLVEERFQGEGGLSRAGINLAGKIGRFGIGIGTDIIFGMTDNLYIRDFDDDNFLRSGRVVRKEYYGTNIKAGVLAELTDNSSIAVAVELPSTLSVDEATKNEGADSSNVYNQKYELPLRLYTGGSYTYKRYRGAIDLGMEFWSDTEEHFGTFGNYQDVMNYAVGIERLPLRGALDPWYEKMIYRLGFRYDEHYLTVGKPGSETSLTNMQFALGLGIPLLRTRAGILDIALTLDIRGDKTDNGLEEKVYAIQFGWSSKQKWFKRRPR